MSNVITNENELCQKKYDIYWQLGKECLWIELHQNKLEQSQTVKNIKGEKDFYQLAEEEV